MQSNRSRYKEQIALVTQTVSLRDYLNGYLGLKDTKVRSLVRARIARLRAGNFGDYRRLAGDLYELRIHYGAGYRIYCGDIGGAVIILLCGGSKQTQKRDIATAKQS